MPPRVRLGRTHGRSNPPRHEIQAGADLSPRQPALRRSHKFTALTEFCKRLWRNGNTDLVQFLIFCKHKSSWRAKRSNPGAASRSPWVARVGAKDYSSAPLTEPDVRATHPALWIDISEVQRELNRNLRAVKPRRRRDRSFSRASLFATESFAARMRPSAHPFHPPKGCRQHEAQLSWSRLSQSIS